jgi:hypothetical protein
MTEAREVKVDLGHNIAKFIRVRETVVGKRTDTFEERIFTQNSIMPGAFILWSDNYGHKAIIRERVGKTTKYFLVEYYKGHLVSKADLSLEEIKNRVAESIINWSKGVLDND